MTDIDTNMELIKAALSKMQSAVQDLELVALAAKRGELTAEEKKKAFKAVNVENRAVNALFKKAMVDLKTAKDAKAAKP